MMGIDSCLLSLGLDEIPEERNGHSNTRPWKCERALQRIFKPFPRFSFPRFLLIPKSSPFQRELLQKQNALPNFEAVKKRRKKSGISCINLLLLSQFFFLSRSKITITMFAWERRNERGCIFILYWQCMYIRVCVHSCRIKVWLNPGKKSPAHIMNVWNS